MMRLVGADSLPRRILKRVLHPMMTEERYAYVQALSKAWDIRSGGWSEPEIDLVPLAVRAGDTVLDLGANFGLYAYHLSRAAGRKGKVIAFEPVPFTYGSLRIVTRLLRLRNVEVVPKGVSDREGTVEFEIPLQDNGAMSAGMAYLGGRRQDHAGRETQIRWKQTRRVVAEVVRLDAFLPSLADLPFIKADVEGAELMAFSGGERTIARHLPTVLCEINPWYLEGFGVSVGALTRFFFDKGYGLYRYEGGALKATAAGEVVEDNYVFVHPSRAHRLQPLIED